MNTLYIKIENNKIVGVLFYDGDSVVVPEDFIICELSNSYVLNNFDPVHFKYEINGKDILVTQIREFTTNPEELIQSTYQHVVLNSDDIMINMELGSDTNEKVTLNGTDSLILMELLLTVDEKLTQFLNQKV